MRKQTKIAAVVSAAALLALGASMASFAAAKGTWMMVDGEWYCYDKNGDAYTNTFCSSNGKEYYVGDDGQLVRSAWVEDGADKYFVNSSGAKITNDWRLTTLFDDDSADEEWYYFQSKLEEQNGGSVITFSKKNVNSKSYFFNEDGEMLSQFIEVAANPGEDTGLVAGMYYFGGDNDGSMKTGSQAIKDDNGDTYKFYFENKSGKTKGAGITGNKSGYLYFKGLLIKADDYKYQLATIDGHTFIVNKNGSIQKNCVDYKEDSEVLFTAKKLTKADFVTTEGQWKYSLKAGSDIADNITDAINIYDIMPEK